VLHAGEIQDVGPERVLTPELEADKAAASEQSP
jgi:hypothetical protein